MQQKTTDALAQSMDQDPVLRMVNKSQYKQNRKRQTAYNESIAENEARTALVLGGGAPNLALMAGAVAAFDKEGIRFDVVSTSGAGALVGLIWLASKRPQTKTYDRLRDLINLSVSDEIYKHFPINYKVFQKGGVQAVGRGGPRRSERC